METIDSFTGEYRFLSNFYPCLIRYGGLLYPSVEHAYQAAKTDDVAARHDIRISATAGTAKRLGQRVQLRSGWETQKIVVMRELLREKFRGVELAGKLIATGTACLVEGNTWNDHFWGVCGMRGQNWLGRLLMEVRIEISGGVA